MITKYFSKVIIRFNPFGKEAKVARLVLAAIPPTQRNMGTQIQSEIISDYNKVKPLVKVTYKDKKEMEVDPSNMNFQELANHFDRHSKQLDLKHMLEMH
ncbi:HN1_G0020470.mRNA.1.CDS.1 [Saccharomyces cerevisiae]|nr:HN1_G0020470.mRNA.1.CDS.1 [Saccharomyces cerevisiae]CAI4673364.1 BAL_1a_G0042050.mRNA.1.CDS.1 [Saccharomyces cerevisiae]CAI7279284.1 BAL_1a_G0042050.mRNA.1.CDS.1 [Saccharomyces cerevisiae]